MLIGAWPYLYFIHQIRNGDVQSFWYVELHELTAVKAGRSVDRSWQLAQIWLVSSNFGTGHDNFSCGDIGQSPDIPMNY